MEGTEALVDPISAEKAIETIQNPFAQADDELTIEIDQVSPEVADKVVEHLDRVAEGSGRITYDAQFKVFRIVIAFTPTHGAQIDWMFHSLSTEALTIQESEMIRLSGAPRYTLNSPPVLQGSIKEPDAVLVPYDAKAPAIIFETGWSETKKQLLRNKDIWLHGFPGQVQAVIIIKWQPDYGSREVSGVLEVHKSPATPNQSTLVQSETIYPTPTNAASQLIQLSKAELFAGSTAPIHNPAQLVDFTIDQLRDSAQHALSMHGFRPKV